MTSQRYRLRPILLFCLAGLLLSGVGAQTADLLVVNKIPNSSNQPGSVSFVDHVAGKVLKTLTVGREPHEVALSGDGRYALVANTGGYENPNNTLSLIDVDQQTVDRTIDLGPLYTPHGIVYSPANRLFYFTVEGSSAIGAYDVGENEVVWVQGTGQAGSHMLLVSRDGRTIVTANRGSGTVSILKLEGEEPLAAAAWNTTILPVGRSPEGLAFGPDERTVWVGLRSGDGLVLVDLKEASVTETVALDGHSVGRLAFSPDGSHLIAADPGGSILFIDPESRKIEKTIKVGPSAESLFLPPGGTHLLVGVGGDNAVAEIDLAKLEVTRKLDGVQKPDAMAWISGTIPMDSIRLSDPYILADEETQQYYMTGTGGWMWSSSDLKYWKGPFRVTETDPSSWMGPRPMIWAAELHAYNDKYYNFATFTNRAVQIDTVAGNAIDRRASHVLVSDDPDGPYVPMADSTYLPADMPTLDGTFWVDTDGKPYMIYCHEWLQNLNGTMEKIELKPDLSGTIGQGEILFRASDSPWSREKDEQGNDKPNKVTDGPFLFRTGSGRLGMIWTSWVYSDYVQGVAYSESGTLDGPWMQEEEPITPPNFGHGMLFETLEGKALMAVHSHTVIEGRYHRVPHLFEVDLTGDKLVVVGPYRF